MMKIVRVSSFTGKENVMILDVTPEQINAWQNGELIQNAMPHLSPEEREFLITGSTPEEWEAIFG